MAWVYIREEDQFTLLVYYLTYLLGCKDVDVFSVAGGSKLSDIFIIDRREINSKIEVDCSHHSRVCCSHVELTMWYCSHVELTGKKGRRERGEVGRKRGRKGGSEGGREEGTLY